MLAIIVTLASSVGAVLGVLHSYVAQEGERTIWVFSNKGTKSLTALRKPCPKSWKN
jgi:hypothetical protein